MPEPLTSQPARIAGFAILALAVCNVVLGLSVYAYAARGTDGGMNDDAALHDAYEDTASCNVGGIDLRGDLLTYVVPPADGTEDAGPTDVTASETVTAQIRADEENGDIKAILLVVDSYGGAPVAAEEIAAALKRATKPTVAVIREAGDSAAYWAVTGAKTIFASANSDVGSIGVTSSYVDYSQQNARDGLQYIPLSSGKYKDAGDPNRPLTAEERELFLRDIKKVHENFIAAVAANRNLPVEKVRALADGSAMLGDAALANGLIDKLGLYDDALAYLGELLGEDPVVCY